MMFVPLMRSRNHIHGVVVPYGNRVLSVNGLDTPDMTHVLVLNVSRSVTMLGLFDNCTE